jgi:dienelactone hydrolase
MASIVIFHSMLGLRAVELNAAARPRAAGHDVVAPDLYAGRATNSMDDGSALMHDVGWVTICARAASAIDALPDAAVMAGFSMGAGVIGTLWPSRPLARGVLLFHGFAAFPDSVREGFPLQAHIADSDPFASREELSRWEMEAGRRGLSAEIFRYAGVGHFFTDPSLPDYNSPVAESAWRSALSFLGSL